MAVPLVISLEPVGAAIPLARLLLAQYLPPVSTKARASISGLPRGDSSSSDDIVQLPHGMYQNMEEQLAEAQRIAHLGSWEWDIASNAITWSDETYRIYGFVPRSVAVNYELYQSLIHPDDLELGREVIRTSLASGEPFDYEHRIVRPDGTVRLLNARGKVIKGTDGNAIRMFGTGQDITERREAEVALRNAAEELARRTEAESAAAHLNRVFAQAPVVIAVVRGPDHVFETVNPKFLEKIFEPFWQVEQTTSRRAGGTGLGLAVTRQFVKLLHGELTVSSEVGVGSTFTLSLPT